MRLGTFLLLVRSVWALNCSIEPLYVDIYHRDVSGGRKQQYGTFVGIGSPPQNHTLWPSLRQNETSLASSGFCANSDLANCDDMNGGVFDHTASTTWRSERSGQATNVSNNRFTEGIDILSLYTHYFLVNPDTSTEVNSIPVMLAQSGSTKPGILGIGSASTILNKLYDAGLIAARTYSLYIGTGFTRAGGNAMGSNVFGGYDSGRFQKPVYTYYMDKKTPDYLSLNVSDIIIDDFTDPTKQRLSLMADETFKARITTDRYPMLFPYQITQRIMAAMNASPAKNGDNSLKLNRPFNGSMTVLLSDGFNVTFSPSALYNVSGLSPIENTPSDYTGPYYLSTSWLTQIYLSIDFDAEQFHLAHAIPHAPHIVTKTLCPGALPTPYDYSAPAVSFFDRSGLIGAIVGGALGGSAILVLLVLLVVLWRRRRLARAQDRQHAAHEKAIAMTTASSAAKPTARNLDLDGAEGQYQARHSLRHSQMLTPTPVIAMPVPPPPPITTVKSFGLVQTAVEVVDDEVDGSVSEVSSLSSRRGSRTSLGSRPRSLISDKQ